MQSKPKKKSVTAAQFLNSLQKKKSRSKKKYICINLESCASKVFSSVEEAYKDIDGGYIVEDCTFYEVKEVKVVSGVRLA